MFFLEGNFSVDSFFFIGGFLVSLNALGTMEKYVFNSLGNKKFNYYEFAIWQN